MSASASFGVELGRLMLERHLTYRELSRLTGLAPPALNHYTNGRRHAADDTIELIASALEVEPAVFYEWRRRRVLEHVTDDEGLVEALWRRLDRSALTAL